MTRSRGIGRGGLTQGQKLPRVVCPAEAGPYSCGGKVVAADPVTRGAGLGKIRNHKRANLKEKRERGQEAIQDLIWCPGSGEVVDIVAGAVDAPPAAAIPAQRAGQEELALFEEPAR